MPLSAHVDGFLVARSYAPNSERQRRIILHRFVEVTGDPPPSELTPALCYLWWGDIGGLAAASRRAHLGAVRTFIDHLVMLGVMASNPVRTIATPKEHRRPPVTLTDAEVGRLMAVLHSARDRVAVALMVGCALRAGDLARLRVDDIDMGRGLLTVTGKGGRVRLVPMTERVAAFVADYLAERGDAPGQLLVGKGGRPLSHDYIRISIDKLLERAGLRRGVRDGRSSHVLRRTAASSMLEHGASITDVQAVLGHSSIATTQRYLAVPDAQRLLAAVERGPLGDAA